jgi:3-phosphoshikimate 1-carboxyvinyltransferase
MTATRRIEPLDAPPDADIDLPGSKSITNRALVAAALADGRSRLEGVLFADDTEAMLDSLTRLGVGLAIDRAAAAVTVDGCGGRLPVGPLTVDARLSGTTSRFLLPLLALGAGPYVLDGGAPLRRRPMGPSIEAVRRLGATVDDGADRGHLPVTVAGPAAGGTVALSGDVSSQFLSGLLLAGPRFEHGVSVELTTGLVSRPYVAMTAGVMRAFGATVTGEWSVAPTGYRAATYAIEPDASAATYFLAAAAICGGRVRVAGLHRNALQGDVAFADVLGRMGADVRWADDAVEVRGTGALHGIDVDLGDLSDTAQTLAAVAVFADSPTRVTGIGFIRGKETDRIAAVVHELRRCGVEASEEPDGFVLHPGTPHPAVVQTYDDHRMAMSFALLGLRVPGIEIADPGCVAKTFPGYWDALEGLRSL